MFSTKILAVIICITVSYQNEEFGLGVKKCYTCNSGGGESCDNTKQENCTYDPKFDSEPVEFVCYTTHANGQTIKSCTTKFVGEIICDSVKKRARKGDSCLTCDTDLCNSATPTSSASSTFFRITSISTTSVIFVSSLVLPLLIF